MFLYTELLDLFVSGFWFQGPKIQGSNAFGVQNSWLLIAVKVKGFNSQLEHKFLNPKSNTFIFPVVPSFGSVAPK
jgi:hypothetical protein